MTETRVAPHVIPCCSAESGLVLLQFVIIPQIWISEIKKSLFSQGWIIINYNIITYYTDENIFMLNLCPAGTNHQDPVSI